jgi:hypothetical protein
MLRVVDSFKTLKQHTRVPKNMRKLIRNSKKTTFIYPNKNSFRVIDKLSHHHKFINKFKVLYSTSANETNKHFKLDYARYHSDIEVIDKKDFTESNSSKIFLISKNKLLKIR